MSLKERIDMATTKKPTTKKTTEKAKESVAKMKTAVKKSTVKAASKTKATEKKVASKAKATKTTVKKATRTAGMGINRIVVTDGKINAKVSAASRPEQTLPVPTPVTEYKPDVIEPKWQAQWEQDQLYRAVIDPGKQKFYFLTMLPYPSGDLHIGHWYTMAPSDARARYLRMQGYNVMFPIGFDAFGLPAENAAIKRGIHPKTWTYANIDNMRRQLRSMGAMFDWEREAVSADPEYYKWTEWFFAQFFKHGLAYKKLSPVDWCPNCNTTLAREQVWGEDRHCERCGTPVIKKNLDQWYFRITNFADELLSFEGIDWPERVKTLQTNWIGKSEGAQVVFHSEEEDPIEVFTTRPDTLWGATFMVLAPEHPLVARLTTPDRKTEVEEYVNEVTRRTEIEREAAEKDKTGVFIGAYAVNPVNGARIPIWIADYVLMTYGTGAIMAVPAHDERDFQFALKFGLPILPVIDRPDRLTKSFALGGTMSIGFGEALRSAGIPFVEDRGSLYITIPPEKIDQYVEIARYHVQPDAWNEIVGMRWLFIFHDGIAEWNSLEAERRILARCQDLEPDVRGKRTIMEMLWAVEFYRDALYHAEYGAMIHSGSFTGTPGAAAKTDVIKWLEKQGTGKGAVTYRIRDWLISRQRYWGSPIPIVYCLEHGQVAVPDDQLPVLLPDDVEWKPTGESPLKLHPTWKYTTCPICGQPAERDTDTMDTFMCSSWYHLRYLSPKYDRGPFDPKEYDYWMPVDAYTGGIEHATMHLIYTRFFHKALRDLGIVKYDEPMLQQRNQGQILGPDNQRMSKSRGNVVDPDVEVHRHGADTVRAYLMFGYRWADGGPWSSENIEGVARWLNRVWHIAQPSSVVGRQPSEADAKVLRRITHQTIKKVTNDLEAYEFNTIIAALMTMTNGLYKLREATEGSREWNEAIDTLLLLMAPITPHIAEELWVRRGKPYSIHQQKWPAFDAAAAAEELITLVVQINGKVRDRIEVAADIGEVEAQATALASENVQRHLEGKEPKKIVYVKGKLVSIVI
jgi:leucyl-tRNA synthetase